MDSVSDSDQSVSEANSAVDNNSEPEPQFASEEMAESDVQPDRVSFNDWFIELQRSERFTEFMPQFKYFGIAGVKVNNRN